MHPLHNAAIIALLAALAACSAPEPPPPTQPEAPAKVAEAAPKAPESPEMLSEGAQWTPFAFAAQWARIDGLPEQLAAREKLGAQMRSRWEGRTLRWTGVALASLCVMGQRRCAINVFERSKTPKVSKLGGFFPMVQFTGPAFAALREGCAGQTSCVVTFTARLSGVQTEPGRPLSLTFEGAGVDKTRQPEDKEQWFGRSAPKVRAKKDARKPPTGRPTSVKLSTLVRKTF